MGTHIPHEELRANIEEAKRTVEVGALYEHFKGGSYRVKDIIVFEANDEFGIAYYADEKPEFIFVRPLTSFLQEVEKDGKRVPRFKKL